MLQESPQSEALHFRIAIVVLIWVPAGQIYYIYVGVGLPHWWSFAIRNYKRRFPLGRTDAWLVAIANGRGLLHVVQEAESLLVYSTEDGSSLPYVEVVEAYLISYVVQDMVWLKLLLFRVDCARRLIHWSHLFPPIIWLLGDTTSGPSELEGLRIRRWLLPIFQEIVVGMDLVAAAQNLEHDAVVFGDHRIPLRKAHVLHVFVVLLEYLLGNFLDLRKYNYKCIFDFEAGEVYYLGGVVVLVHLVESEPGDIKLDLVLHVF